MLTRVSPVSLPPVQPDHAAERLQDHPEDPGGQPAVPPVLGLRRLPGGHGAGGEPGDHQADRRRHRGEGLPPSYTLWRCLSLSLSLFLFLALSLAPSFTLCLSLSFTVCLSCSLSLSRSIALRLAPSLSPSLFPTKSSVTLFLSHLTSPHRLPLPLPLSPPPSVSLSLAHSLVLIISIVSRRGPPLFL